MESDGTAGAESAAARFLPPVWLFLAVSVFFLKPLFLGVSFQDPTAFHHDLAAEAPSIIYMVRELYAEGRLPLWIANQNLGSPELGLLLPGLAHPLTLLLMRFDPARSFALYSLVNSELIALFAFLLFRRCGASSWGSAAAGFLTAMTGFVSWVSLVYPASFGVTWLLCWLWSALGLGMRPGFRAWAWNAFAVFMLVLSGDAQIAVQAGYLLPVWYLLWLWRARVPRASAGRALALLGIAAVTGLALAALQLLPAIFCFSQVVNTRTPGLGDYAATFPKALHFVLGGFGLFSRFYRNLFFTLFALLLAVVGVARRRENPAWQASLILGAAVALLVMGGRSGLSIIPFHLPLLSHFIRHYKLGVILQGPLFIGVALGFDAMVDLLRERRRAWMAAGAVCLLITLLLVPGNAWRVALVLGGVGLWLSSKNIVGEVSDLDSRGSRPGGRSHSFLAAALFLLLILDAGSYLWQTPNRLAPPPPDPLYVSSVKKLGAEGRVQGMYSWITTAAAEMRPGAGASPLLRYLSPGTKAPEVKQLLPVHGNGYYGEHTMDSWLEFPLANLAFYLYAISPRVARLKDGKFSDVDFWGSFKSTDFITPENRRLVNLAGLRYFFLQDLALSASDRFPILSDPAYFANAQRPRAFEPFQRGTFTEENCPPGLADCPIGRPYLLASQPGRFHYEKPFSAGDRFAVRLAWPSAASSPGVTWAVLTGQVSGKTRLLLGRAVMENSAGTIALERDLELKAAAPGSLDFMVLPRGPSSETAVWWIDPQIRNPQKTIRYREGTGLMVFENMEAMARVRLAHRTLRARGNLEAVEIMRDPKRYDPLRETLLMDDSATTLAGPAPDAVESARLVSYKNDEVKVAARLSSPGYLVLADSYYPGWRAFVGSEELRIYRADLTFRAVLLPPGNYIDINFYYLPWDFRIGWFATLSAGLGFVLCRFIFFLEFHGVIRYKNSMERTV